VGEWRRRGVGEQVDVDLLLKIADRTATRESGDAGRIV
jgi:hypothetical protein